jgi:peptidoglycan/LPS O-acetylase OafA/YrhL
VPFVAAYLVLAPITRAAYQYARETASTQSIQAGIDVVMRGEWLMWRKPYHLWFLVALLIFTWIAVGGRQLLLRFAPRAAERIVAAARSILASRWRAALVALVIAPTTVTGYLHGNGNIRMPLLGMTMLLFFVLGWLLYRHRDLLPALGDRAWRLIAIAVLATPATVWGSRLRLIWQDDTPLAAGIVAGVGNTILAACMTLGLLGLFQAHLDRPSAAWRYISDASYWIYLIHLPLVIAVSATLSVTPYPAAVKYLMTVAIVVPIVMASYHFGVRHTAFGGKRKTPANA